MSELSAASVSTTARPSTAGPFRRVVRLLTAGALTAGLLIVPIAGEAAAKSAPQGKITCGFCVK